MCYPGDGDPLFLKNAFVARGKIFKGGVSLQYSFQEEEDLRGKKKGGQNLCKF